MESALENDWCDEEGTVHSDTESSVAEETEALLYSLIYHKPPSEEEANPPADVSPSESASPFSVSRWSKASRWDRVKRIVAGPENTSSFASEQSLAVTSSTDPGTPRMSRDARENVFKNQVPEFIGIQSSQQSSDVAPARPNNWRAANHTSSLHVECDQSAAKRSKPNLRAVLEALAGYPPVLEPKRSKKKKKKKSKSNERLNLSVDGSSMSATENKNSADNEHTSASSTDHSPSKYNVTLVPSKVSVEAQNVKNHSSVLDVIELLSDSDSEGDSANSIVVVERPPKTPPPLIELEDSSDELENRSIKLLMTNPQVEQPVEQANNLIVNCSHSIQQAALLSVVSNLDNSVIILSDDENRDTRKRGREGNNKKKKKKKGQKKKKQKQSSIFVPAWSDISKWTAEMARFYNQSWGCRDLEEIRQKMPGHPQHWRIMEVDRYGPLKRTGPHARIRCRNCNQLGHPVSRCPDPTRKKMCHMCGGEGHMEPRCPNKICLKCGRPCSLYTKGCRKCSGPNTEPCMCVLCKQMGHYSYQCPTAWRGLHMETEAVDPALQVFSMPVFKPSQEMSCCVCAAKGHCAQVCRLNSATDSLVVVVPNNPGSLPAIPNNQNIMMPYHPSVLNGNAESAAAKRKRIRNKRKKDRGRHKLKMGLHKHKKNYTRETYVNYMKIS